MLQITKYHDKQTFELIVNYVKAGGKIGGMKKMMDFCAKYQIDPEKLGEFLGKEKQDDMMEKLRAVGLLP